MPFLCLIISNGPHFPRGKILFHISSPTIPYPLPSPRFQVSGHAVPSTALNSRLGLVRFHASSRIPLLFREAPLTERTHPFLSLSRCNAVLRSYCSNYDTGFFLIYLCICVFCPTEQKKHFMKAGTRRGPAHWAHRRMWGSPNHKLNKWA